ncbi:MAG: hypothetical protein JW806_03340 [Sedimentisphaerales bacterium]|nr:hypothetical protein [Sedimentisphaerales bacterium]
MKVYKVIVVCLAVIALAGCSENTQKSHDTHELNSELIRAYSQISINNAIVSRHTLFPYHFVDNSAELNELGKNDLGVLIKHYKDNPGTLNITQGDATDKIYLARVTGIIEKLGDAGVDKSKMIILDGIQGGRGMPSEEVLAILQEEVTNSQSE